MKPLLLALGFLLTGCFPTGTREAQRYFVLEIPDSSGPRASATRAATLIVPPTAAEGFYDTQDLVYSRSPGTRAYYQFNSWTERPAHAIHSLLVSRLERSGAFRSVAESERAAPEGLVLRTRLEALYHDAAAPPGSARVVLGAELFDPSKKAVLARRTFLASKPSTSYDAAGAVQALREATAALLDELVAWVDEQAPR
jgi:cholesterol transport system auxiliary component